MMKTGEVLVGYAAKFDEFSQPINGAFLEIIRRGAFTKTLARDDIRSLINHDSNMLLGRNRSGTLSLQEDNVGLKVTIRPPDTTWGRDILESVRRGDMSGMSFAFSVAAGGDAWLRPPKGGTLPIRELLEVQLFEVSPVTFPAYLSSSVSVVAGHAARSVSTLNPARPMPTIAIRRHRLDLAVLCA